MSQAADSAGVPFAGRKLRPHPFAGDDGLAPEQLTEALDAYRRALGQPDDVALADAASALVEALRAHRVLIPLVAEAGDTTRTPDGRVVEKSQELSVVTVAGPTGAPVGVMFSGVPQMSAWRGDARPVPVEASRVAAWALTESVHQVVVDPGVAPAVVVRQGMLWSVVNDSTYVAPWLDERVVEVLSAAEFVAASSAVDAVKVRSGWRLDSGHGPDVVVSLSLVPGLGRGDIDRITRDLSQVWAGDAESLALVDGIRVELVVSGD